MASVRQKARIVALQALYEADMAHHSAKESVERLLLESRLSAHGQVAARELVCGVVEHQQEVDQVLQKTAPQWPLNQVAAVDRNILRLAIYEILFNNRERSMPRGIVINEAVDLAKSFGSEKSPGFVNGVLGHLTREHTGTAEHLLT
ncbi:MAG TPA: transcription antitermination factor NusB [Dehalococcoidia bacterium]|nr:transcription antitermination factor NusB [Dehalococcoidia bacterium]